MEGHVRIFREKPFGWFDKPVMRYLREKYGKDKKAFLALRSVYLAICEMESDFESDPIVAFNKTAGTYAGLSREAAGKYVRLLEHEGLIQKTRIIDPVTHLKSKGTYLRILSSQEFADKHTDVEEGSVKKDRGYATPPSVGVSEHSDTPAVLKKIGSYKKLKNVKKKTLKKESGESEEPEERIDYYAGLIADKFGDRKSFAYYKNVCRNHSPERLLQKAGEIITDGGAKNPAAVFVSWLKKEHAPPSDHPG
jgi:hypothetical protein